MARRFGLFLTCLLGWFAVSLAAANNFAQEAAIRDQLRARAAVLAQMQARLAGVQLADLRLEDLHRAIRDLRGAENVLYAFVLDEDGLLLTDGGAGGQMFADVDDPLGDRARERHEGVIERDDTGLHAAEPVFLGGGATGVVRIGLSLEPMHRSIRALRLRTLAVTCVFLALGLVCSWLLLRRTTLPLAQLTESTKAAARGRFEGRLRVRTNDELQILAAAFNGMLARLERSTVSRDYVNGILNTMSEALLVLGPDGAIKTVNAAACRLLDYADRDLLGRPYGVLLDPRSEAAGELARALRCGDRLGPVEASLVDRRGDRIAALLSGGMMADRAGGMVLVAQDIRIRKLAFFDAVTELPNRVQFMQLLGRAVAGAGRHGRKLAVLFLDLDGFKLVNNSYGHDAGDRLLKAVADRLARCLRSEDILARASTGGAGGDAAAAPAAVARLGGDEFTLLITDIRADADAARVAERLLYALAQPFDLGDRQILVGTSIGIALYPDHGTEPEALLKNADRAMAYAKQQGRNNAQLFSERMTEQAAERMTLLSELRRAVAVGAFALNYQPQVDLRTGLVVGVEALIRWHHPRLGTVSPAVFIPLAEETGLAVPIGAWVLRAACEQARNWLDSGVGRLRMGINISGLQVERDDFVDQVRAALDATGLAPELLELEVTETAAVLDPETTAAKLGALRELGVGIAIDDFGTGYSSLNYLKSFPVDKLKIDRSFIQNLVDSPQDAAVVQAILGMARALKLGVIAEGVETERQFRMLRAAGCGEMQGYFASPPLPPEDLVPWLLHWRERNAVARPAAAVAAMPPVPAPAATTAAKRARA